MKKRDTPSYLKMICPVCGNNSVVQAARKLGVHSSKFHCSSCGNDLKVRPTVRVIWGFVMALLVPAGALLLHLLQQHIGLPKVAIAAINGALIGGGLGYSFSLLRKGMVFQPSHVA